MKREDEMRCEECPQREECELDPENEDDLVACPYLRYKFEK